MPFIGNIMSKSGCTLTENKIHVFYFQDTGYAQCLANPTVIPFSIFDFAVAS